MSLLPVDLQPGIYTEATPRSALNRYKDGNNVRFFKGYAQKIGGWNKLIDTSIYGICRALLSWTTTTYERLIGLGTNSKLYICDSVNFFDVTPVRATGTLGTDPFTTTSGSQTVTVHSVAHGLSVGDFANYLGSTAVGGLSLDGDHQVTVVVDADNYQFQSAAAATSGATGGGSSVAYIYDIPAGNKDSVLGTGWGAGGWGVGTWGTSRVSGFLQLARIWSLVNWGEDMVASPVDNAIYIWLASEGTNTRAVLIPDAPAQNRRVLVSDQLRIMISFGSHDGTNPDPMLLRWSDTEDYTDWTPSPTNLAGDQRLDNGSEIISAVISRDEIAIFTDTTIYSMTMTGDDLVFGFDSKGQAVGLAGPNAAIDVEGTVYAFGRGQFYTYDGEIKILPCDVHSRIFDDLNYQQAAKVFLTRNKLKSEIIGFYPSANSIECDKCFGYNYDDGNWWLGDVQRTAWLDTSPFFDVPIATGTDPDGIDSLLYLQETGVDADGAPLAYSASTYDLEISAANNLITGVVTGSGENIFKTVRIFPDFQRLVGKHFATVTGRKYPNDKDLVRGPRAFTPTTKRIDVHMRARQISVEISSNELGADISMGAWRLDSRIQGNR